jgi:tetratricopeptide (TPR) repeat protein
MTIDPNYLLDFDLFQQIVLWLHRSMCGSRQGCQYLEHNLWLIGAERELARLIHAHAEEKPHTLQQMRQHLALLQDARQRGGTQSAVREAYVNIHGGLTLDLPPWLMLREQDRTHLARLWLRRPDRTRKAHVTFLRTTLSQAKNDSAVAPETIAELHNELGQALLHGPHYPTQAAQLQACTEAITCHEVALQTFTPERYPLQYARTHLYLGKAYQAYGLNLNRQPQAIEQAITSYQAALLVCRRDIVPELWVQLQTALGNAYLQCTVGNPDYNIGRAITYHQAALNNLDAEASPTLAAQVHINLGDAYRSCRTRSDDEKAMASFRAALRIFSIQDFRREWADIHVRLASLFYETDEPDTTQRATNIRCSIICFEGALNVSYSPDAFPVERATTLVSLGHAHRARLDGKRQDNLKQAISCYREALNIFTSQAFPTKNQQILLHLRETEAEYTQYQG